MSKRSDQPTPSQEPTVDYGFRAIIPRIVRTAYKDVTATQKWLYVCLKDLCGNHGVCYRTLEALSEETDLSTGMLSESIRILHDAGLIHAEKKRRSSGGKAVWHITIVDIWGANAASHPTKRSQNEATPENVHIVNENLHNVNEKGEEYSHCERESSQNRDRSNKDRSLNITEVTTKEESEETDAPSFPNSASTSQSPPPSEHQIPPSAKMEKIFSYYDFLQGFATPRGIDVWEAVKKLEVYQATADQMKLVHNHMAADSYWKTRGGFTIVNIANNWVTEWTKVQQILTRGAVITSTSSGPPSPQLPSPAAIQARLERNKACGKASTAEHRS